MSSEGSLSPINSSGGNSFNSINSQPSVSSGTGKMSGHDAAHIKQDKYDISITILVNGKRKKISLEGDFTDKWVQTFTSSKLSQLESGKSFFVSSQGDCTNEEMLKSMKATEEVAKNAFGMLSYKGVELLAYMQESGLASDTELMKEGLTELEKIKSDFNETDLDGISNKAETHQEKLNELIGRLKEHIQNNSPEEKLNRLEKELEALKEANKELEAALGTKTGELEKSNGALTTLQGQYQVLKEQLDTANKNVESLTTDLKTVRDEKSTLEQRISQLNDKLETSQTEHTASKGSHEKELEALKGQLESCQRELETKNSKIKTLTNNLVKARNDLTNSSRDLHNHAAQALAKGFVETQLKNGISSILTKDLQAAHNKIEQLTSRVGKLEQTNADLVKSNTSLKGQLSQGNKELQEKLQKAEQSRDDAVDSLDKAKQSIEELTHKVNQSGKSLEQVQNSLSEIEKELVTTKTSLEQSKEKVKTLSSENSQLEAQVTALKTENTSLQEEKASLTDSNMKLTEQLQKLDEKCAELKSSVTTLTDEKRELTEAMTALKTKEEDWKGTLTDLSQQLAKLKLEQKKTDSSHDRKILELNQTIRGLTDANKELQQAKQTISDELEEKDKALKLAQLEYETSLNDIMEALREEGHEDTANVPGADKMEGVKNKADTINRQLLGLRNNLQEKIKANEELKEKLQVANATLETYQTQHESHRGAEARMEMADIIASLMSDLNTRLVPLQHKKELTLEELIQITEMFRNFVVTSHSTRESLSLRLIAFKEKYDSLGQNKTGHDKWRLNFMGSDTSQKIKDFHEKQASEVSQVKPTKESTKVKKSNAGNLKSPRSQSDSSSVGSKGRKEKKFPPTNQFQQKSKKTKKV